MKLSVLLMIIFYNVAISEVINMTSGSYRCDDDNNCSNKEIICSFSSGSCHIACMTPYCCTNTTMRIEGNALYSYLAVKCYNNSCINSNIFDAQFIETYGEYSINGTIIYSQIDETLNIYCYDSYSCSNAIISATLSERLYIQCKPFKSCHDITIYCPPSGTNYHHCEINGNSDCEEEEIDIHRNINIHAPNGWSDIGFIDYTAFVLGGKMYCGGKYSSGYFIGNESQCDIEYGVWDCKDPLNSPCSNQYWFNSTRETFICDHTNNGCNDNNDKIICKDLDYNNDDERWYSMWSSCNILCQSNNSCNNQIIQCPQNKPCFIICSGSNSCNGLIITTSSDNGLLAIIEDLTIICGLNGNYGACQNSNISTPRSMSWAHTFRLYLYGINNLINTTINCGCYRSPHYIQCNYNQSCKGAVIYAVDSSELVIQCNGDFNSCSDLTVYCPDDDLCEIRGASNDLNRNLQIYAKNGWDDIDVSGWINKGIIGNENKMNCGYDYNFNCIINDYFNCSCPQITTSNPTTSPTSNPSISPTESFKSTIITYSTLDETDDGKQDESDDDSAWFIIGIVFICIASVALLILAYFIWKIYFNDKHSKHGYNKTKPDENPQIETGNLRTTQIDQHSE